MLHHEGLNFEGALPKLLVMLQTTLEDSESGHSLSGINCYFMRQDGTMFKAQVTYAPYFYLQVKVGKLRLATRIPLQLWGIWGMFACHPRQVQLLTRSH